MGLFNTVRSVMEWGKETKSLLDTVTLEKGSIITRPNDESMALIYAMYDDDSKVTRENFDHLRKTDLWFIHHPDASILDNISDIQGDGIVERAYRKAQLQNLSALLKTYDNSFDALQYNGNRNVRVINCFDTKFFFKSPVSYQVLTPKMLKS